MKMNFRLSGIEDALGLLLGVQALGTFAADEMTIDVSGQVGIGAETPEAKLHIACANDAKILVKNLGVDTGG
jgi:hypothetical protein